jgi:hypothetical protein
MCSATLAILLLGATSAHAQGEKGGVEVGGIFGTSLPVTWLRAHADRRLTMGSLDVGRMMTNTLGRGPLAGRFELLLEITPLTILQQSSRLFGLAASPLHMRWNFAPEHRFGAYAEASGGVLITSQPFPPRTTTFNFLDQAGFGLRVGTGARLSWLGGYRFQHISNAGRVKPNPGANFNFAYVGVSFHR